MENLTIKNKKEIRAVLTNKLHDTIKTLGVVKSGKKVEKILDKASKKLAVRIALQLKKEMKKMQKASSKVKKEKKVNGHQPVAA
mgnify:CR=1 FL=1